jgi:hypothetical protein
MTNTSPVVAILGGMWDSEARVIEAPHSAFFISAARTAFQAARRC